MSALRTMLNHTHSKLLTVDEVARVGVVSEQLPRVDLALLLFNYRLWRQNDLVTQ